MSEMAAPVGKWANPALLEALVMGFYGIAKGEGLSKEAKDSIIEKVHLWGFTDITWEGIRFKASFSFPDRFLPFCSGI
ncbi:hypothetical protein CH63R_10148 [Colletotrichum higginsianum IMI 349063]|uniref:Uncharacterized protein n=2 Tax=Colletotrichum higginsianum TaxID=80884 RepID=A0A1B7Y1Y7_COLHI|nr:uncharacterized protein CH63R_10148 [Colletotrichum higginsianum IMI 349063]OBR06028.1 hypothetical protein CH63R_10148 [Colletotrichum higginsianum IMI 349063]TIC97853.1 hypothetical protein CH35J_007009 [Colletotrichum higginsianum]